MLVRRGMGLRSLGGAALLVAMLASACAAGGDDDPSLGADLTAADPAAGWHFLANGGYIGTGIPANVFYTLQTGLDVPVLGFVGKGVIEGIFPSLDGAAVRTTEVPDRDGPNANLTYRFTSFKTSRGNDVINFTCLTCHTGVIDGKAIIGLGDTLSDYTGDLGFAARTLANVTRFIGTDADVTEANIFAQRFEAIAPYVRTTTVGANPAVNLTYALMAHRDPKTLAWSDAPLMELPPETSLPYDVPAWWHMKKRSTAFVSGEIKFHQGTLMLASLLGTESAAELHAYDRDFQNVQAYIKTLEPPAYPLAVDHALATEGSTVYARSCASCHGTYGEGARYPETVFPLGQIGTDPRSAEEQVLRSTRFYDWIDASPYSHAPGGKTQVTPTMVGYLAPPLDGVWATAPYLHNGSIPTLEGVLDSTKRPVAWSRIGQFGKYDTANMGVKFIPAPGKNISGFLAKYVYDTRDPGYSNAGHTFGDALSAADRTALLEYLKTL